MCQRGLAIMLPSQKRLLPYEALSACVQPQEKGDRLTDKPGDSDCSFVQSPVSQGEGARQFNKNPSLGQEYVPPESRARNFYISLFHASFMGRCKSMCLTDKLFRDFF